MSRQTLCQSCATSRCLAMTSAGPRSTSSKVCVAELPGLPHQIAAPPSHPAAVSGTVEHRGRNDTLAREWPLACVAGVCRLVPYACRLVLPLVRVASCSYVLQEVRPQADRVPCSLPVVQQGHGCPNADDEHVEEGPCQPATVRVRACALTIPRRWTRSA